MVISLLTEHYDLDRALETNQGLLDSYVLEIGLVGTIRHRLDNLNQACGILAVRIGHRSQSTSADPENLAIAVAMFSFFRALGQAIGVAVGGVVFQNRMFTNPALHTQETGKGYPTQGRARC
jgi:hypothetical protein